MKTGKSKQVSRENGSKLFAMILVVASSIAWLVYAVMVWNERSGVTPKGSWADRLCHAFADSSGLATIKIYLSISGFVFFAYLLTVLLPAFLKRLFPKKKGWCIAYRIAAAVLLVIAAAASVYTNLMSVNRPARKWLNNLIGTRKGTAVTESLKSIFISLTPVSLALIGAILLVSLILFICGRSAGGKRTAALDVKRSVLLYLILIILALLATCMSASLMAIVRHFSRSAVNGIYDGGYFSARRDSVFFSMVILAPFIEDTAFRGVIQHHSQKVLPKWAAILFTAVLFGIWHRNIGQFIYTTVMGIIWGIVYLRTGRLRHTILIHLLQNLFVAMAFSSSEDCILGRIVFAVKLREWLWNMGLVPAVIAVLVIGVLLAACEFAVIRITGGEDGAARIM